MANVTEIFRSFPLLFILVIIGPIIGGFIGAYMGYDNLNSRLETNHHRTKVENELGQLSMPIDALRRYEQALSAQGQNLGVLKRIISQYDQLTMAVANHEKFMGRKDSEERIAAADHIIGELRFLLGTTQTAEVPGGTALIIKSSPNTFRVTFSVPMRIPPDITFFHLPPGVEAHILEKTKIGFLVTFTPTSIPVETISFTASAEL